MESDDADGQATLTVRIDGDNLHYHEQNQRHAMELEITSLVFDSGGKQVHGFVDIVTGNLTPERFVAAQRNGFRVTRRLALKPGVYQARVGVRETATDRIGTAFAWIEVPNLSGGRLALSSLILNDPAGADTVKAGDIPTGNAAVNSRVVRGVRLFSAGKVCAYFIRVQKGGKTQADVPLAYQVELIRSGKPIVQQDWLPVTPAEKDGKGISVTGQFSLAGLASGIYELRVTVKELQSKRSLQRTAIFGVE
jgi:hypothetical protein